MATTTHSTDLEALVHRITDLVAMRGMVSRDDRELLLDLIAKQLADAGFGATSDVV